MKRVLVTMEFVLRDEHGLRDLDESDLITEIRDMVEDEHCGLAEYGSAGVAAIMVKEI